MEDHEVGERGSRPSAGSPGSSAGRARPTRSRCGATRWPACALAGWMRSPARLEHRGHRVLGEPVDLEVGMQLAQLVGDRDVALGVAEADRRGDVERALAAATCRATQLRAAAAAGATKSRSSRLTLTGSRACGQWPDALERRRARRRSARRARRRDACGRIASSVAVDHEHRAAHALARARARSSALASLGAELRRRSASRRRLEPPADAVLDLLGRVRLGEDLREEELEEAAVVARASSGGCTSPSPRRCRARSSNGISALRARLGRRPAAPGAMKTTPVDALGVLGGEQQRPLRAERERDEHGALGRRSRPAPRARRRRTPARRRPRAPPAGRTGRCRARRT